MPHNYNSAWLYTELTRDQVDAKKAAFWNPDPKQGGYRDFSKLAYNKSFREWYELLRTDANGVTTGQVAFGQKEFGYDFKQYPTGVKKLFTDDPVEQKELAGGSDPAWNKIPTQTLNIITHTFKIDSSKYSEGTGASADAARYDDIFEEF